MKSEVRDLEDSRAGALEVANPLSLQPLDRNKLWEYAKRDFNMPADPEWLDKATTSIEESRRQNKERQAEAEAEMKASIPTFLNVPIWPDDLRRAVKNGELNPFAMATPTAPEMFENHVAAYLDLRKALERNSDFLPKKFMSKFPNLLTALPKGTSPDAGSSEVPAGRDRVVKLTKDMKKQRTDWALKVKASGSSDPAPKSRSGPPPPEGNRDLGLTYEFSLVTGSSHVTGAECPEDKKLLVRKWMLK